MMRARKTGEWDKVLENLTHLEDNVENAMELVIREVAADFLEFLHTKITDGELRVEAPSEAYVKRKIREGLQDTPLIATGEYIESFGVTEVPGGIFAGVFGEEEHTTSGVSLVALSLWLEEGTSDMPAMPHFEPAWEEYWPTAKVKILTRFAIELRNIWRG